MFLLNSNKKNHLFRLIRYVCSSFIVFVLLFSLLYGKQYMEVFAFFVKDQFSLNDDSLLNKHTDLDQNTNVVPLEVNKQDPKKNIEMSMLGLEISPPDNRIIIAKVSKSIPIVEIDPANLINGDTEAFQQDILKGLENGVAHYPLTPEPGETGNFVLTGHSSYYSWADGDFKDAFVTMHNVEVGDKITIYYKQKKFIYEVFEKKVVDPTDVSVLENSTDEKILTTITCTPIGTNKYRLIHRARLVYGEN